MMITKMALPRRTFLRGVGATLALPFLDAMVPALTAMSRTAAAPTRRLGFTYVPNGVIFDGWTPTTDGAGFELPSILAPLEGHRDQVVVVSNLALRTGEAAEGEGASRDATLVERFRRASPDMLEYEFTVHDPATWTTSWTARQTWQKNTTPMFEYACHEGNYGLTNMMRFARHEEEAEPDER